MSHREGLAEARTRLMREASQSSRAALSNEYITRHRLTALEATFNGFVSMPLWRKLAWLFLGPARVTWIEGKTRALLAWRPWRPEPEQAPATAVQE